MAKKQFKTESKKLMDLMINSIYTNKEIFLRELISNASDAIDKLHYRSLTDKDIKVNKKDFKILISMDEKERTLTISDNGCGMTEEELENNLGTIAKSGSLSFKEENEHKKDIDIIGQFGVGFYSAFMVASNIKVISKAYGAKEAYLWESSGVDGYTITKTDKKEYGTDVILTMKEDTEDNQYSEYLKPTFIENLIKKYSNYITYPIIMHVDEKDRTVNDMVPLWKRNKNKIERSEYNTFYSDKFFDYEEPARVIHYEVEGNVSYNALLFIPNKTPFDYYTKEYEKGLQLYSNGVLIMEKCSDLLPDYFSFVKGVIDSQDLSLNISREMLQQDKAVSVMAKSIETKISKDLKEFMDEDREHYEKFYEAFGPQLKFGIYDKFGTNKDKLKDYILFHSSKHDKLISLKEYVDELTSEDKNIYYVCGDSLDKIKQLPVVENFKDKDIDVLYCVDYMDEFVLQTLGTYEEKKFVNIAKDNVDLGTEEEKAELKKKNEDNKDLLSIMKEAIPEVTDVRFTNRLKNHPVCLVSEGDISIEMEKVINAMPTDEHIEAKKILEINEDHKIVDKLESLYNSDKEALKKYSKILFAQACLIEGLPIDNPTELTNLICDQLSE